MFSALTLKLFQWTQVKNKGKVFDDFIFQSIKNKQYHHYASTAH